MWLSLSACLWRLRAAASAGKQSGLLRTRGDCTAARIGFTEQCQAYPPNKHVASGTTVGDDGALPCGTRRHVRKGPIFLRREKKSFGGGCFASIVLFFGLPLRSERGERFVHPCKVVAFHDALADDGVTIRYPMVVRLGCGVHGSSLVVASWWSMVAVTASEYGSARLSRG